MKMQDIERRIAALEEHIAKGPSKRARDEERAVEVIRWLLRQHQLDMSELASTRRYVQAMDEILEGME